MLRSAIFHTRWLHRSIALAVIMGSVGAFGFRAFSGDEVGDRLLEGSAEPSFESVASVFPPFKYPREVVGVPDHPQDAGLDYLGRLQFIEDSFPLDKVNTTSRRSAWVELGDPPAPIASNDHPFKRALVDDSLPIYILTCRKNGVDYEQTTFGYSEGYSPDGELFILLRVRVRSVGGDLPRKAQLVVGFEGDRYDRPLQSSGAQTAEINLKIPYNNPRSAISISPRDFDKLFSRTRQFWEKTLQQGIPFKVPEPRVNHGLKMWRAYSLLLSDRINGHLEPHDGAGVYDLIYGYSAAKYALMLDAYGDHARAGEIIDTMIQFQNADGLYTQNFGLPDQGMFMHAMAEHFRLGGDAKWLRARVPALVAAGDWIIKMRAHTPNAGVTKGLIKWRPYCDFPQETYNYFGNVTSCIGLESAAGVLKEIGLHEAAERFDTAGAAYRRDILESMNGSAFQQDGSTVLPLEPDTHRLWNDSGKKATDYYGLSASTLLETDFFAPEDPRGRWICDALERDGLCAGLTKFQKGLDHAYTYGYLRTMLRRGQPRQVILGFYSMLAFGMTRDTFSPVEATKDHLTGYNCQTLPHLYSCTVQEDLLRMMLLREHDGELSLCEATPRAWLKDGNCISASSAPTCFGDVSFSITSHVGIGEIDVKLSPCKRKKPDSILLHLRHPEGAKIKSVRVNGKPWKHFGGETIELEASGKSVTVKAIY
jgi:hypothetical protein